ncbi:MAG: hypothetical protein AB7N71_05590 [Phycisphaerae bacterium]
MRDHSRKMMRSWRATHAADDHERIYAAAKFLFVFVLIIGAIVGIVALVSLFVLFPRS